MAITERFKQAWKAFLNKDPTKYEMNYQGISYSLKPDRPKFTRGIDRTIVSAVYTRIAVDCANCAIQHVQLDSENRFIYEIDGPLNDCFSYMANIDQTGRDFLRDCVVSLLDEGSIAIVPVTTEDSPYYNDTFKIYELRVGKVVTWFPKAVRVRLYNEEDGQFRELTIPKQSVALVENPFYSIMNEPNSTLQRLIHKLSLIDSIDDQQASGKLDLIIQLPYTLKTEAKQKQAEDRRGQIEAQLTGSKYGIAYIDGTEHITQLNRPVENNLMSQVEYLTKQFYSQLGITEEIMNGSASEEVKNEYYNHVIEPILTAITEAMNVKFLSANARTRKQAIRFYRQPLKVFSISSVAELADKLTRNEICTGNEIRQLIGLKPSQQPSADELRNKNNLASPPNESADTGEDMQTDPQATAQEFQADLNDLKSLDSDIAELEKLVQSALTERAFLAHSGEKDRVLIHSSYKSEYYDPVKAHEYYERTKQLKGYDNRYGGKRTSSRTLNEKGRQVAGYVKQQINARRDSQAANIRENTAIQKERNQGEKKKEIDQVKSALKSSIANLKSQLNSMNEAQRKHARIKMRKQIESLKAEADKLRETLNEHYKGVSEELSEKSKSDLETNRSQAADTYELELQNMLKDPSLSTAKKVKESKEDRHKLAVERRNK